MDAAPPADLRDASSDAAAQTPGRVAFICCRTALAWTVALTGLHLALALPYLRTAPRANIDESWEACTGYSLVHEGRLRNPAIYRSGIDRAFIQPRITQSFVLAGAYRLLGVSLGSGRLASALIGWAAVIGVFYLMRTYLSCGAAGLITLLFMVDTRFFIVTRTIRPEVYVVCAGVWMLALLARGIVRRSWWRFFVAGLVGGVGCYTHPNMALVIIPSLLLIVCTIRFRRPLIPALAGYAMGGVIAVIPFLIYVAYAQSHYQVSFAEQLGSFYTGLSEQGPTHAFRRELGRWWWYFQPVQRGPWVLLVAAGMVWGAVRRHPLQVWGLIQVLGHALFMLMLIKNGDGRYLVVLAPWFAAFVGLFVLHLWEWTLALAPARRRVVRALAILCVCGTCLLHLAGSAYVSYGSRQADYDAVCQRIRSRIPPGARVYGNMIFWTGLYQYPYLSELICPEQPRSDEIVPIMRDRLIAFSPQFVVRTSAPAWLSFGLGPAPAEFNRDLANSTGYDLFRAIQTRFCDEYIARHRAALLDRFTTHDFGTVEVYRFSW